MIALIKGELVSRGIDSAIIMAGGVGYQVYLSSRALSKLPETGTEVQLLTHLQVRDDAFVLYGFTSGEDKELFAQLISVTGVGPKVALSVLSTYTASEVVAAVASQDVAAIQRVPGVGKKMASRIVLELKGSLPDLAEGGVVAAPSAARKGAADALLSMGFTSEEIDLALKGGEDIENEAVLLQYALKRLAG